MLLANVRCQSPPKPLKIDEVNWLAAFNKNSDEKILTILGEKQIWQNARTATGVQGKNLMEPISYLKFIMVLALVLAMIAGGVWLIKRLGFLPGLMNIKPAGQRPRLDVVESKAIDARRRLLIVRCDEAEHLLLLGPNSEIVVAENIQGTNPPATSGPESETGAADER